MSKCTPGPWEARPSIVLDDNTAFWSVFANGRFINPHGSKADALLMAAAPEMLAVLEGLTEGPLSLNELNELMANAREVIAKAKGEKE